MEEKLILGIVKDTKIKPYEGEAREEYLGRLVYSAMGQWLKIMTLDTDNQDNEIVGKSKSYVFTRGREILDNMILAMPACKEWFWNAYNISQREKEHPIRVLYTRMLNAGELIEVGFKTSIGSPQEYITPLVGEYERLLGLGNTSHKEASYVGVTRIKKSLVVENIENSTINSCDYIEWLEKIAKWEPINDVSEYEFFQPLSKAIPHNSWTNSFAQVEKSGLILGRIRLFNALYEYYLIKKQDNQIFTSKISLVLNEFKEERRVILGLRKLAGNPMRAQAKIKEEVIVLRLFCRLPLVEERKFETYCWPKKDINDKINYVIPIELWDYFKLTLEALQIQVEEQANG